MILKSNEKGATLIEVLGVMAVLGAIAVGLFAGIARVQKQIKITQAHEQVTRIVKRMRTQFASFHLTDSQMTAENLEKAGIYDNGDVGENGAVNVFGTSMRIENHSYNGSYPAFWMRYNDIPSNVCVDLIMADWGDDPSSGLAAISGGSKSFAWKKDFPNCGTDGVNYCLPAQLDDAVAMCSAAPTVDIIWVYYY